MTDLNEKLEKFLFQFLKAVRDSNEKIILF